MKERGNEAATLQLESLFNAAADSRITIVAKSQFFSAKRRAGTRWAAASLSVGGTKYRIL